MGIFLFSYWASLINFSIVSTISRLPQKKGTRWCNSEGSISKILSNPLEAFPPACSVRKAIGLHSYNSRNFPLGDCEVEGYIYTPPFIIFL